MVKKIKVYLCATIICIICTALFVGIGYLYISASIKQAEKKQESIPYSPSQPENAGILFDISGSKTLLFFNFQDKSVSYIDATSKSIQNSQCCGYSVDYTVSADYSLLSGIIDRIGTIELYLSSEAEQSYTGIQVIELLESTPDTRVLKGAVVSAVLERIAESGFSRNDFAYIIENSSTDLSLPDCYNWNEYIKTMCAKTYFVN